MNFRAKKLCPQIIHLIFNTDELMCKTMCRFAEHFESPQFRGKVFSWRQFKSWYTWDKGSFTYYTDWGGYNMPSKTFENFKNGSFDPLTWGEQHVLEAIKDMAEPFYVIATSKEGDEEEGTSSLRHELGHAFYSVSPEYMHKANEILASLPAETNAMLKEGIKVSGYNDEVLHDELHAYLIDGIKWLLDFTETKDFPRLLWLKYWWAGRKLNKLLDKTLEKYDVNV